MSSVTLVDATDLSNWAVRRDAQARLPQVLRRLVHATVDNVLRIGFPSGESVQLGGWDGILAVEEGNAFVPAGTSAWELSANEEIERKANSDYEKRISNPRGIDPAKSTFVFVTLRRWPRKEEWANRRRDEGIWQEVRAYDADQLEQWLEIAPAVHIWLSILLGKHPEDAVDLESYWADWSATTRPATTAEFVLSGRRDVVDRVHGWFTNPSAPFSLRAGSRDEAVAVFAAVLQQLPPDERIVHLSRTMIVRSLPSWIRLTSSVEPLLLVPLFDAPEAISRALRTGHRVVIPLGPPDSASSQTVDVPRLSREEAAQILIRSDIPEDRARDLAALARRSLMSFRRKLAVSPEVQQPVWARPAEARPLLPALLAGAWDETKEADRETIARLARVPYEELSSTLVRWSNETDPPVRHVGDAWFALSKDDMWSLLAHNLTRDDLERLEEVAVKVLGTADPRFDLPAAERWMAAVRGRIPRYSSLLREGLADTLGIMGARGETIQISEGVSARGYATRIIRRILDRANADWRVWASLSSTLPLLGEAVPDVFLSGVEEGLVGVEPPVLNLFTDEPDTLFGDLPHTGLLWALETIAWSREHLGHASLILAKLARLNLGGRLGNRPQSSLQGIFLLWHPQTSATLDQRLRVLDMLREREPDVAWRLLRKLVPEHFETGFNTHRPRWREWAPDSPLAVNREELSKGVQEVALRMLTDVGDSGNRWQDLIKVLPILPGDRYEAVVERLASMDVEVLHGSDRAAIWNSLRELISDHRSFPDAEWALPQGQVDRLQAVLERFAPTEPFARYGWLFSNAPKIPDGRKRDRHDRQEALETARLSAVESIYRADGLSALLELVGHVEQPGELGFTLGNSQLASAEEDALLREHLAVDDRARAQFARGFAAGRVRNRGAKWVEEKLASVGKSWSAVQRADLLVCLPNDAHTWTLALNVDSETENQYWRLNHPYRIEKDDVELGARKFLEHGRPYAAVDLLAFHATQAHAPSTELIAEALERILRPLPEDDRPSSSSSHDVHQLLDILAARNEVDESRIAALEWGFLPILGRFVRPPKLLHRELARNPDFFAQVVALVYQGEGEEPRELTPEEHTRWERAHELLDSWRIIPGRSDAGSMQPEALKQWVRQARVATDAMGRRGAGDQIIGRVLSNAPGDPDGTWPHKAVRDVIEEEANADIDQSLEIGVYNNRGTVTKHPTEGGVQERQLAARYEGFAAAITDGWPRTASILRRIAERYRAEALQEDQRAQLREDLHGW